LAILLSTFVGYIFFEVALPKLRAVLVYFLNPCEDYLFATIGGLEVHIGFYCCDSGPNNDGFGGYLSC